MASDPKKTVEAPAAPCEKMKNSARETASTCSGSVHSCSCSATNTHSVYSCSSCQQAAVAKKNTAAKPPSVRPATHEGAPPGNVAPQGPCDAAPDSKKAAPQNDPPSSSRGAAKPSGSAASVASSFTRTSVASSKRPPKALSVAGSHATTTTSTAKIAELEAALVAERAEKERMKVQVAELADVQRRLETVLGLRPHTSTANGKAA